MRVDWPAGPPGPELPGHEVHVWMAPVGGLPDDNLSVLSNEERAHAGSFRIPQVRVRWATSRALLRVVLGHYLACNPHELEFATVDRGRRVLRRPRSSEWLSFSHARSGELCVVAVARSLRVGIDIERVTPDHDVVGIARRAFGGEVAGRLSTLPAERRVAEFFRTWVAEEARGKCRGTGLVEPDDAVRSVPLFVAELDLQDGYAGALAVESPPDVVRVYSVQV